MINASTVTANTTVAAAMVRALGIAGFTAAEIQEATEKALQFVVLLVLQKDEGLDITLADGRVVHCGLKHAIGPTDI